MKQVVVTGSLAFDQVMNMPGRFADHILADKLHILNVSFLVDTLTTQRGGTGGNIAYNLALLGVPTRLVAAAGKDGAGYKTALSKAGVDVSGVRLYKGERTATGFAIADRDDNQIWAFYQGAMKRARALPLGRVGKDALVMIAPNDPKAVVGYVRECVKRELTYVYDPAFQIPHYTKGELKVGLGKATVVMGNDYEIALMRQRAQMTEREFFSKDRIVVTTLGAKGSWIRQGRKKRKIPPAKPKNSSDPTGAGDAYRAGFVAGFARGLSLDVCGRMGSVAAVYTVEKYGTQTHRFGLKGFKMRYKRNFGKGLGL